MSITEAHTHRHTHTYTHTNKLRVGVTCGGKEQGTHKASHARVTRTSDTHESCTSDTHGPQPTAEASTHMVCSTCTNHTTRTHNTHTAPHPHTPTIIHTGTQLQARVFYLYTPISTAHAAHANAAPRKKEEHKESHDKEERGAGGKDTGRRANREPRRGNCVFVCVYV